MSPEIFIKRWTEFDDNLNQINRNRLNTFGLSKSTMDFLIIAGLPRDSAPFLSFSKDSDDIHNGINRLTKVYDFLEIEFDKYIVIGSCDGDPIVINTENNDRIEYLDHEDYFSSRLFNSDINSMAECLIIYRNFVESVREENGEDAFLNSNFTDEQFEKVRKELIIADSNAMRNNGFWSGQIAMDLELREENQNEY